MEIKAFPYETLTRYSQQEANLLTLVCRFFPLNDEESPFSEKISTTLKKIFGDGFSMNYGSIFVETIQTYLEKTNPPFVGWVVSLTPLSKKVMIELDSHLSFTLIDKLLGGSSSFEASRRGFTKLEEGVLEFLLTKLLKESLPSMNKALNPCFEQVITHAEQLKIFFQSSESMVFVTFQATFRDTHGFCRVGFPASLISDFQRISEGLQKDSRHEQDLLRRKLKKMEHIRSVLWAEMGRVNVHPAELGNLEVGDIILLDDAYPEFDGKKISGEVRLHLGEGNHGGFLSKMVSGEGALRVKVESVFNE